MAEESGTPSTPHFQGIANNQLEESRTPSTPLLKGTAKIITEESGTLSTPHFQSKAKILSRIIWYTQYTNFSRPHRIFCFEPSGTPSTPTFEGMAKILLEGSCTLSTLTFQVPTYFCSSVNHGC